MNVTRVDSVDDPRLAGYAQIGDERWLAARGWFVAEGRFVVERLVMARRQRVLSLLVNEAALAALAPALAELEAPIFVCAPRFFERLTGHHFHRGCLALAERPPQPDTPALLASARALVVLDRVADADNVGSVFRSSLALGVAALWLAPGCADPLSRKAIRTSMGATLRVPFVSTRRRVEEPGGEVAPEQLWPECLPALEARGFCLLGLSPREPSRELRDHAPAANDSRWALLIGSEGAGLSAEAEAAARTRLRIAMQPGVDSLNLGVATGIALHWLLAPR
ncbi:MAG TPA: RNA methyltransferase [Polyangiaceae bacterium]|nr:RNA methyltransferase [Polyangiaceae bacterium]